jgi:hypothetical protein
LKQVRLAKKIYVYEPGIYHAQVEVDTMTNGFIVTNTQVFDTWGLAPVPAIYLSGSTNVVPMLWDGTKSKSDVESGKKCIPKGIVIASFYEIPTESTSSSVQPTSSNEQQVSMGTDSTESKRPRSSKTTN